MPKNVLIDLNLRKVYHHTEFLLPKTLASNISNVPKVCATFVRKDLRNNTYDNLVALNFEVVSRIGLDSRMMNAEQQMI